MVKNPGLFFLEVRMSVRFSGLVTLLSALINFAAIQNAWAQKSRVDSVSGAPATPGAEYAVT
jgi:hypothetical protein